MLLKQYERIGEREFDLAEFREMLGIEKKKYAQFKDFRKWVLNQAKKEFDRKDENGAALCDITFDLETMREGRRINRLKFIIRRNQYQETLRLEVADEAVPDKPMSPVVMLLMEYGIREAMAERLVAEQGDEAIRRCVELYREQLEKGKVRDRSGGYLVTMLEAGAGTKNRADTEQEQQAAQAEQQKQAEKAAQALAKRREALSKEFATRALDEYLSGFSAAEKEELLLSIRKDNPMLAAMMKSLTSPAVAAILVRRIPEFEQSRKQYIEDKLNIN